MVIQNESTVLYQAWKANLRHVSKIPPMKNSFSQSWNPVKENKMVARVAMEGFSARVLVMFVRFAEIFLKSITLASRRERGRGM